MRLSIEKSVSTSVMPSHRVLETASMFGIGVDDAHRLRIVPPTQLDLPIPGPGVVYITGPSGGGKSTVLSLIASQCIACGVNVIDLNDLPPPADKPLVDLFDLPLKQTTSLLAAAGLGDAFVMLRSPDQLSDGQQFRLRLARAMHLAAHQPSVILADEFGATLDRLTAAILARSIRRWANRMHCTFLCATTHEDLLEALSPDVLVYKGLGEAMQVVAAGNGTGKNVASHEHDPASALSLERATTADYNALRSFHYRSAKPGAVTSGYRLVHRTPSVIGRYLSKDAQETVVGVLLRTLPHLACTLRDAATSGRYRSMSQRAAATMLNREIRTIARVVVHPQWRGLGLAVRLVRHALANPEPGIVYTEALAAMGHVHPFFERAGMVRYERPPHAAHARLADALASLGIEPAMLASSRLIDQALGEDASRRLLLRELRRWHRAAGRRSSHAGGDQTHPTLHAMLDAARNQLLTRPVYYLHRH